VAIKIVVSNKVGFKVKGTINDAAGVAQPFDFGLTCKRLDNAAIDAKLGGDFSEPAVLGFMLDVIEGWSGVRDDDDKPVAYTEDAFRDLCKIPGVLYLAFKSYREESGVKAKN